MPNPGADEIDPIAERNFRARSKSSGQEFSVKAIIGRPRPTGTEGEMYCPVVIEGLQGRLQDIRGIDAIDALRNAIKLAEILIEGAHSDYDLFWPDGEPLEREGE
jgi:hypothetical protein